jgi:hypothetical protein
MELHVMLAGAFAETNIGSIGIKIAGDGAEFVGCLRQSHLHTDLLDVCQSTACLHRGYAAEPYSRMETFIAH